MDRENTNKEYLRSGTDGYSGPDPFLYRLHALSFLECAELSILGNNTKNNAEPTPKLNVPIIHLICHAIEMFLKLALYKTGSTDRDLKAIDKRHNLSNLMQDCETAGVNFSSEVKAMVEALSPLHQNHSLRYKAFENAPQWLPIWQKD